MNTIFGDLNARIHSRLNGEEPWIGEHVFGRGKEYLDSRSGEGLGNCEQMMGFCMSNDYLVMSALFS